MKFEYTHIIKILIGVLLSLSFILPLLTTLHKSNVWDEPYFITEGFILLKTGLTKNNIEKSLITSILSGMPLLFTRANLPPEYQTWIEENQQKKGSQSEKFLFNNTISAEWILFLSRIPILLCSVLLAYFLYRWSMELFGTEIALLSLGFYVFCPVITGFAGLATSDMPTACFIFLSVYFFYHQLINPTTINQIVTGCITGLALLSKLTSLYLIPLFIILFLIYSYQQLNRQNHKGFQSFISSFNSTFIIPVFIAIFMVFIGYILTSDPLSYWHSITYLKHHIHTGHPAYLMGQISNHGWLYYFPIAILIKTPIPLIIGIISFLIFCILQHDKLHKSISFVIIPPTLLILISIFSSINIGIRHILPTYPFFCLMGGIFFMKIKEKIKHGKWILYLIFLWYGIGWFLQYPYDLAYFNEIIGGSKNGHKYLLDSNSDWGQDLKGLSQWIKQNHILSIYVHYFGTANLDYHQIPHKTWPDDITNVNGYVAVSANYLYGLYLDNPKLYTFLQSYKPVKIIGYTIFVYYIPPDESEMIN